MNAQHKKKVLMISMDSADSEYLLRYLPHLPHLKRLLSDGRFLNLNTTAAHMDATVWPTFYSEKLPGEHGAYFPFQWDFEAMRYRRFSEFEWFEFEPFWNRLGEKGIAVGLLDIMMLPVPPKPTQNISYYHWHTQDEGDLDKYNNSPIWREAKGLFGSNKLGYDISADMTESQRGVLHEGLLVSTRNRGRLTRWLIDNSDWRLFITSFSEIHRAGHYFTHDPQQSIENMNEDLLLSSYKESDKAIGHILEGIDRDSTHVIIFSLSGMGPNNSQSHFLTNFLQRFNQQVMGRETVTVSEKSKPGVMRQLREKLPGPLQIEIAKRVSQKKRDWVVNRAFTSEMNWDSTLVFHVLSGGQGYMRWNIAGREREGILDTGNPELKEFSKLLQDELYSLTAVGNGKKIVKRITDIPAIYPGPYASQLPDFSIIWEDMAPVTEIFSDKLGVFKGRIGTGRGGNHRDKAFAITSAPESEHQSDPIHIVDLGRYVESLLVGIPMP
jgi:predicted AlkP superfamily phosphohydrolase/phosphomutase